MTAAEKQILREPTQDERDGMAWWNGLSPTMRAMWLSNTDCETAAEAWERYKVQRVLAEQYAAESRVVAEHDRRPFDLCVTAGAEFGVIREMARAMEAAGDVPVLTWFRDEEGLIIGVTLVGHMARAGLRYEPVTP